ncbi:hypothetical protein A5642_20850 [Mycolicibacterium mucogenicum]|uniref:Uncharacterized protein n=1 Tax=Mycolicibacterium mucogenicum TaxID=56689 RepID=A0A1A0MP45_MYCMU|nr:hypothetical protein [Mycolicibacterium mucogenicum]OBA87172.1 hypothetical protein A5642_20850 [Mycolicibacterium mucogenicum]
MRREDALLAVAGLSVSAFVVMAGPSAAMAAADPGGSNGNGGNSSSTKGPAKNGGSRGNAGNGNSGNSGSGPNGNSGAKSSFSGQTATGKSSKANGNGGGRGNNVVSGARSNSGSDSPAAVPTFSPPNPPQPVVVAEQHTGTTAGRSWWAAPAAAPLAVEVHAPAALHMEGDADLLAADHTGIPVWAAAEPVGLRGDLFGLAGLVLMPLIGLAVGYRQAKAARDIGQTLPS